MADKPLFVLDQDGRYRLGYDQNQWVVQRRSGTRRKGQRAGQVNWEGFAFVGGTKNTLWRIFREDEIWLTDAAISKVDAMPDHFFSFLRQHDPELARRHPIWNTCQANKTPCTARSHGAKPPQQQEAGKDDQHPEPVRVAVDAE